MLMHNLRYLLSLHLNKLSPDHLPLGLINLFLRRYKRKGIKHIKTSHNLQQQRTSLAKNVL